MKNYDDIINMKHHISHRHASMPISDRAAQFSSFSALTGYDDVIDEVKRYTDEKIEFDEYIKSEINGVLKYITDNIKDKPAVRITYYLHDEKKAGGKYITDEFKIIKYDEYENAFVTDTGKLIKADDIRSINVK